VYCFIVYDYPTKFSVDNMTKYVYFADKFLKNFGFCGEMKYLSNFYIIYNNIMFR